MNTEKEIIWLIDDSEIIHKAIKMIMQDYRIHSFYSGESFLEFVERGDFTYPDLILLDLLLSGISGFETLERLMMRLEFQEIPVIILSTLESIDDKVRGLESGATDYIVKPFYEKELSARVRVHIKMKKNQDALRRKVILDFLTNTYNKRHLYTRLNTQHSLFRRHESPISLIFFDIDLFKVINDTYGHLTGDWVLKELCIEVRNMIRAEDDLFRYGGEEFVIMAPYTSKVSAEKVAEKIRRQIMERVFEVHEEKIQITLSIGVASLPEDEAEDLVQLLEIADRRMLMAKRNGRNRVASAG